MLAFAKLSLVLAAISSLNIALAAPIDSTSTTSESTSSSSDSTSSTVTSTSTSETTSSTATSTSATDEPTASAVQSRASAYHARAGPCPGNYFEVNSTVEPRTLGDSDDKVSLDASRIYFSNWTATAPGKLSAAKEVNGRSYDLFGDSLKQVAERLLRYDVKDDNSTSAEWQARQPYEWILYEKGTYNMQTVKIRAVTHTLDVYAKDDPAEAWVDYKVSMCASDTQRGQFIVDTIAKDTIRKYWKKEALKIEQEGDGKHEFCDQCNALAGQ